MCGACCDVVTASIGPCYVAFHHNLTHEFPRSTMLANIDYVVMVSPNKSSHNLVEWQGVTIPYKPQSSTTWAILWHTRGVNKKLAMTTWAPYTMTLQGIACWPAILHARLMPKSSLSLYLATSRATRLIPSVLWKSNAR